MKIKVPHQGLESEMKFYSKHMAGAIGNMFWGQTLYPSSVLNTVCFKTNDTILKPYICATTHRQLIKPVLPERAWPRISNDGC